MDAQPAMAEVRSLEVRWIFPGHLEAAMAEWFDRFPAAAELQEDVYLLDPHLPGLSVKVRSARAFEVKAYRGSPGILDAAGRARGRMESWQKWSFPVAPPGKLSGDLAGWRLVRKKRRISQFAPANGRIRAVPAGPGGEPGCAVERTEVRLSGAAWWTLGFETTGPAGLLRSHLEATAALVFADPPPEGMELGTENSRSYVEWLRLGLRPDRAEQQVIDDPAAPEQVCLPQQQAGGGLLPQRCARRGLQARCREPGRGGNDAVATHGDLHLGQAGRPGGRSYLPGCHGHAAPQPEHPQLGRAGEHLSGRDRPPLDRNVGNAEHAAGPQHPVTLVKEGLPGPEMERRLHADDPVHGRVSERQPGSVACHGCGRGRPQPVPASDQLPPGDVHRHQTARP